MATSAPRGRAKNSPNAAAQRKADPADAGSQSPRRWWQWLLVYPAFAVALVTAAPTWLDKYRLSAENIKTATIADAEKQQKLWAKNLSCSAAPFSWYNNPSNIKIDATICDSGDIFVRASTPGNGQFFKWLPLEDVVTPAAPAGNALVPTANAASRSDLLAAANPLSARSMFHLAQMANVICQRIDGRYIHRRVATPQGCFDEVIDTYNGQVVNRTPAPCLPQC